MQGIDVASVQHAGGAINWSQVATDKYKFVFIKSTEGSYYANPYYGSDAVAAKAAGLIVAPYAFAIPNYTGGAFQADYALDHSGYAADGHTLPPIIDLENDPYDQPVKNGGDGTNECYGLSQAQMVAWISAFAAETHRRTGESPAIYTTAAWWKTCTGDSTAFAADPLWVASLSTSPAMPSAWGGWTYWQYTDQAKVPGITGKTDASYLSASVLELAKPAAQSYQPGAAVSTTASSLDGGQPVSYTAAWPAGRPLDQPLDQPVGRCHQRNADRHPGHVPLIDHGGSNGRPHRERELPVVRPRPGQHRQCERADRVGRLSGQADNSGRRAARLHAAVRRHGPAAWPVDELVRPDLRVGLGQRALHAKRAGNRQLGDLAGDP